MRDCPSGTFRGGFAALPCKHCVALVEVGLLRDQ